MSCPDCSSTLPLTFDIQAFVNNSCSECQQQNCLPVKYLCYTGPALPCSGIVTGDTLEVALQKIDEQICSATGDYSAYQFNCLPTWWGEAITSEAEFVDAITLYACEITDNLQTFTGVTFPAYQSEVEAQLDDITGPSLTCTSAGVTSVDSLYTVLTKYCTKFGSIDTALDISSVTWNSCFTVVSPPTTIAGGFNELITQICAVKTLASSAAVLPTFNNSLNCLAGTTADTLVETIGLLTDKVCEPFPFDPSLITWDCLDDTATDLQEAVEVIVDEVNVIKKGLITAVSADFVLSQTDPMDACAGLTIELATPLVNSDRLVASNVSDLSPGTLIDKLTAGTNITLDDTTTPGQVIINADNDHLLIAGPGDANPNTLIEKLNGDTESGIAITPTYNAFTEQVDLDLTIDLQSFLSTAMTFIASSPALLAQFCALVSSCGATCATFVYTIFNDSGSDQGITWLQCGNATPIEINLPNGDTIQVCAVQDSVTAPVGVVVTLGDACSISEVPTTTTSTTTTTTLSP